MIKRLLFTCLLCAISFTVMAQTDLQKEKGAIVGIKTNALYWGTATPNLGLEFRLARHWSLDLEAGLNPLPEKMTMEATENPLNISEFIPNYAIGFVRLITDISWDYMYLI